uniref:Putative similar to chymotrypsin-elastase inhibitor ixodidin n=1 Tax=Rhipicephalus pulchellus TaxID=72859 RepID=L7MAE7_RHIPC
MAWNSQLYAALWLTAIVLLLNTGRGHDAEAALEKIKKSCKPGEVYSCISGTARPECGENKCGVEKTRAVCDKMCARGCWCQGKMYRRQRDHKCVPKHECLL